MAIWSRSNVSRPFTPAYWVLRRDRRSESVHAALAHAVFDGARQAARCRREVPITWRDPEGLLVEGVIDLAFEQTDGWTVVDFKTDEEFRGNEPAYRRQVGMYAAAIQAANGARVSALLIRV